MSKYGKATPEQLAEAYKDEDTSKARIKEYLDDLRESGETNMYGAGRYLEAEFGVTRPLASAMLLDWMANFGKEGA